MVKRYGTAKLKSRATADGALELLDTVPIGKEYAVDLDSVHTVTGVNIVKKICWSKDFIKTYECREFAGALPVEILDIKGDTTRSDGGGTA